MDAAGLVREALKARERAYAPYSGFAVGAALLCGEGTVYTGCNIENAAFTPSNCAERTAFFEAVKNGHRDFTAIAVAGGRIGAEMPLEPCMPCGVCLQVMVEFCVPESFRIMVVQDQARYDEFLLGELAPHSFSAQSLPSGKGFPADR